MIATNRKRLAHASSETTLSFQSAAHAIPQTSVSPSSEYMSSETSWCSPNVALIVRGLGIAIPPTKRVPWTAGNAFHNTWSAFHMNVHYMEVIIYTRKKKITYRAWQCNIVTCLHKIVNVISCVHMYKNTPLFYLVFPMAAHPVPLPRLHYQSLCQMLFIHSCLSEKL